MNEAFLDRLRFLADSAERTERSIESLLRRWLKAMIELRIENGQSDLDRSIIRFAAKASSVSSRLFREPSPAPEQGVIRFLASIPSIYVNREKTDLRDEFKSVESKIDSLSVTRLLDLAYSTMHEEPLVSIFSQVRREQPTDR